MNKMIYLNKSLYSIIERINNGENFTLMRLGDGERSLMLGKPVKAQEGWKAPNKVTALGKALMDSISLDDEKIIYGISCPCCDRESYYWYMTHLNTRNITFANIFVNRNYYPFLKKFEEIRRDAVVIANHAGQNNRIGNLNVLKYYPVGDQCVDQWEQEGKKLIREIIQDFGDRNDLLYVFAAGPLSEPIIAELFRNNPNNCYIDFGSSIDRYIHKKDTRPYTDPYSIFGRRNCRMYDPSRTSFDVTVVLTSYKKPDALRKQLEAVEGQSLKPKKIMLYKDGIDDDYSIELKKELLDRFDKVKICGRNTGVWPRFDFARSAPTDFVCIFDDDTIPGQRWLENCHANMMEQEGVYGTIGIVVEDHTKYPYSGFYKVGWLKPYSRRAEVDFVGHSWFVKKEYLDYMFDGTEKYQQFKRAAEDMCLSFKCQQKGVPTFVPPHPHSDMSLWGSMPDTGLKFGNDSVAISQNAKGCGYMRKALAMFVADGWEFYVTRNKSDAKRNNRNIKYEKTKALVKKTIRRAREWADV